MIHFEAKHFRFWHFAAIHWRGSEYLWSVPSNCPITTDVTMTANSITTDVTRSANTITTDVTRSANTITTDVGIGCGYQD